METIGGRELVIGFPKFATVTAGRRGTLRIEAEGAVYGLNLETGERIPAELEEEHTAPLHTTFVTTTGAKIGDVDNPDHEVRLWGQKPLARSDASYSLVTGDDEMVLSCTQNTATLFDRAREVAHEIALPKPIDLADRVTGGIASSMKLSPIYVEPGFIVFMRSPTVLVVAADDLRRALVFDQVRWAIETILVVREPTLSIGAARGKWRPDQVVTEQGSLAVDTRGGAAPIRAVDRLWPPNGWARVELADGTSLLAFAEPKGFRSFAAAVTETALFRTSSTTRSWPAIEVPAPGSPPAGFEALVDVPRVATIAAAMAYAKRIGLAALTVDTKFHYATDFKVFRSRSAKGDAAQTVVNKLMKRNKPTVGLAYAIPALVAIAADPAASYRPELAESLAEIVRRAAASARSRGPEIVYAFRRVLPLILGAEHMTTRTVKAFRRIVQTLAAAESHPAWWHTARNANPDLRATD